MATCPKCKSELKQVRKEWNYAQFNVKAYSCNCGQQFREYRTEGDLKFVLMKSQTSVGWKRVKS